MDPSSARTRLPAAFRLADGSPRYTLSVPVSTLADERRFADYQAELIGGLDREIRVFLDDVLRDGDLLLDVGAGWGLHAFGAATAPGRAVNSVCVVDDEEGGALLRSNAAANGLADRVEVRVVASLADAPADELCSALLQRESGRVFLRVEEGSDVPGVLARGARLLADGRLAAVIWPRRPREEGAVSLADRIVLQSLEAFGFSHLALVEDDHGPVLVPLEATPEATQVISLSAEALEAQEAPDPRVEAVLRLIAGDAPVSAAALLPVAIDCSPPAWGDAWLASLELAGLLQESGMARPILLGEPDLRALGEDALRRLQPALEPGRELTRRIRESAEAVSIDCPVLTWVGNGLKPLGWLGERLRGSRNVALVHLTESDLDAESAERASGFRHLLAGSTWAADALRRRGIVHASVLPTGSAGERRPAPREGWFGDRFVVLSAGPLSFEGGQDRVVAAFRDFHRRHPDALLVAAWHNPDPESIGDLSRDGLVEGRPETNVFGELEVRPWLIANGIAPEAVIDPGPRYFARLGELLREAQIAVFAERRSAGWSQVPARCAVLGTPTLRSAGTGHLDLLEGLERCYLDWSGAPTAL